MTSTGGEPSPSLGWRRLWCLWIEPPDDDGPPSRELRLGFDTAARLLATVVLVLETGEEMVIHAMGWVSVYIDPDEDFASYYSSGGDPDRDCERLYV